MTYKRKLIEVALPLEAINVASAHEKSIRHGHPSTLHLWWSRKPLATCRAVLFASLVDDPSADPERFPTEKSQRDERARLFGIIERLVQWDSGTDELVLGEARAEILRSTDGNPPPVLDPFAGGGSIPLEAQRLGLLAHASDLNPVAVLITKALIEIPQAFGGLAPVHPDARRGVGASGAWKGSTGLAEDVRQYGAWLRDEADRRVGHLYPKVPLPRDNGGGFGRPMAWLWARTVVCPNPACGARTPLVNSFWVHTKKGSETWVEPIVERSSRTVGFQVAHGSGGPRPGTVGRQGAVCVVCESPIPLGYLRSQGRAGQMGQVATGVIVDTPSGRVCLPPPAEKDAALSTPPPWIPDLELSTHPQYMAAPRYGMTRVADLFTHRQLVTLTTLVDLLAEVRNRVTRDVAGETSEGLSNEPRDSKAYAAAVCVYLALALDKVAAYGSSLCTLHTGYMKIRDTFGRQALPMSWDFAEGNPLGDASGSLVSSLAYVSEALQELPSGRPAVVSMADATADQGIGGWLVSTDPPYFDNVPYADLSDFFYPWLRRGLADVYPEIFSTVAAPKVHELVADSHRYGGREEARQAFMMGLGQAFARVSESCHPDYPITVYYAFKQSESLPVDGQVSEVGSTGWEAMLEGLLEANLAIVGTWPMRSELANRMRATGSNALASSVVLVCRPRHADSGITTRKDFVASLKRELPEALRTLQHGNIAPVDLAQASIGPGMAVFSRYSKVLDPDGSPMRIRTALALINQSLDEILSEQEGEFDADTRFAIAWYEQFGLKEAEYGVADVLARAKVTSVGGLVEAGIVAAGRGRVRLLARSEYTTEWDPAKDTRLPAWEATQRLVHALLDGGEGVAAEMQAKLGGLGEQARDLAYRLYQVAERKGWTDEALAYNALVVAWPDLLRGAERVRAGEPSQPSLGLE